VKENYGDRHKVLPKQQIVKEWTFRNTGDSEWPVDTLFIQTNGDNLEAVPFKLENLVKSGDEITISLPLVAPELPGKYCAFFRFVHGDNLRFGQKVWCDILVEAPEVIPEIIPEIVQEAVKEVVLEVIQEVEPEVVPEPLIEEVQEASSLLNESEQRVSSLLSEEQKHEEEPKELSEEEKMKQQYLEELERSGINDKALQENMIYMMNMGYYNFMVNYNLLVRNNNDLIMAINKLCNSLVTESIFEPKH
jgi:hypothetical protein